MALSPESRTLTTFILLQTSDNRSLKIKIMIKDFNIYIDVFTHLMELLTWSLTMTTIALVDPAARKEWAKTKTPTA